MACGKNVEGKGRQTINYEMFDGDWNPIIESFTSEFNQITVSQKNHHANRLLEACRFGWTEEELLAYLDSIEADYYDMDIEEDGRREHYYWGFDSCCLFMMNEYGQLAMIGSYYGGSRDGKLSIGMSREEAEEILGESYDSKVNPDNKYYEVYYYKTDAGYYLLRFFRGELEGIEESLYPPEDYMTIRISPE